MRAGRTFPITLLGLIVDGSCFLARCPRFCNEDVLNLSYSLLSIEIFYNYWMRTLFDQKFTKNGAKFDKTIHKIS